MPSPTTRNNQKDRPMKIDIPRPAPTALFAKLIICGSVFTMCFGLCSWAEAGSIVVDYTTVGVIDQPILILGGTTVTGSANITSGPAAGLGSTGLGIKGGTFPPLSNGTLDLGETMTIDYGQLVDNVTLTMFDIDPAGNVTYQFEAFNGATSLGTFAIPVHIALRETKDLTSLSGNLLFSKVTLSSTFSPPAGLVVEETTFDRIPEPTTLTLATLSLLAIACRPRSRRR